MVNIEAMRDSSDINGLIRLLDHKNPDIQWRAAAALETLGEPVCDPLILMLDFTKVHVRLGAIEILGAIRCPRAIDPLIRTLKEDPDHEARWGAAVALGEMKDLGVIPDLVGALKDADRYVRYGAAKSLESLQWTPDDMLSRAYFLIALQDWGAVRRMGADATGPLVDMMRDPVPATRKKIVELLGGTHEEEAKKTCEKALMDPDAGVRWTAVQSCKRLGVNTYRIPLILARRQRTTPSAIGAAALNLFFFGLGYNYIGKWWGFPVFMTYMTTMTLVQLYTKLPFPFIYIYPLTALSAVQTYYAVTRMQDM